MTSLKLNAGISVTPCPHQGCTCGCVIVRLHDASGDSSAGIVLPLVLAEAFMAQFGAVLDRACGREPSGLHGVRCEGTA